MSRRHRVLALHFTLIALALALAGPASALEKGVHDVRLERSTDAAQQSAIAREIGVSLGSDWARIFVHWHKLEASRGAYSPVYLAQVDAVVDALDAAGTKVLLTVYGTPEWAQDQYWWQHPPAGTKKGPQPFYPPRAGTIGSFGDLGEFLAMHFVGRVRALECWNEPNLYFYLYPQRTARNARFGASTYLGLLRTFSAGVRRARTGIKVVAGSTAPIGRNDAYSTSPQTFAAYLKAKGASKLFDAYSHHPYVPGGTRNPSPTAAPANPRTTVTLSNLKTLLKLFPTKPFYLTEYGYNTRQSVYFGLTVSESLQSRYLKSAYSLAGKHRQVKMLVWFLLYDWKPPTGLAKYGIYTGLRTSAGSRKAAWNAFRALQ